MVIPCRSTEDRKGAETNSKMSGTRNLEADNIRRRTESHRDKTDKCT